MKKKTTNYFDFNDESDGDMGSSPQYWEEGHPLDEIDSLHSYFAEKKKDSSKPRRKMAK
jgi:hypothetical protein